MNKISREIRVFAKFIDWIALIVSVIIVLYGLSTASHFRNSIDYMPIIIIYTSAGVVNAVLWHFVRLVGEGFAALLDKYLGGETEEKQRNSRNR